MNLGKIIGHGVLSVGGELFAVETLNVTRQIDQLPTVELVILNDYNFKPQFEEYKLKVLGSAYLQEINSRKTHDIKEVVFNNPATIVMWNDGTKTVVKCQSGDVYDREKGLLLCIAKKHFGNKGNFNEVLKKFIPEELPSPEEIKERLYSFCHVSTCSSDGCPFFDGEGCKPFEEMTDDELRDVYIKVLKNKEV